MGSLLLQQIGMHACTLASLNRHTLGELPHGLNLALEPLSRLRVLLFKLYNEVQREIALRC